MQNSKQKKQRIQCPSSSQDKEKRRCEIQEQINALLKQVQCLLPNISSEIFVSQELEEIPGFVSSSQAQQSQIISLHEKIKILSNELLDIDYEDKIVDELNQKHAIVHTNQFYILTEKENPHFGGTDFFLESRQSFKNLYENQLIEKEGKRFSKADIWLKSPRRRQYEGITFDPTNRCSSKHYNLWKGFAIDPEEGDCNLYWEHFFENICKAEQSKYIFVRKWVSYVFQNPAEVHTALVLQGKQGVGKNAFVEPLGFLMGAHYLLLSSLDELLSHFNFHLKNAVLIHANEALWGGNHKQIGTLKAMITEKTCVIEGKGQDCIVLPNYKHLIISSNDDLPIHLDHDDRRFFVLEVGEKNKENHEFFSALNEQLKNGGYAALLYDLLNEDVSDFNPRLLPHSDKAFTIKLASSSSPMQYLYAALKEGYFDVCVDMPSHQWQDVPALQIFAEYQHWCSANGVKKESQEVLGRAIKRLIPSTNKKQDRKIGRKNRYYFPPLEVARAEFQHEYKAGVDIWEN